MPKGSRNNRKSSEHYALRHSYKPGSSPRRRNGKWVGKGPQSR